MLFRALKTDFEDSSSKNFTNCKLLLLNKQPNMVGEPEVGLNSKLCI